MSSNERVDELLRDAARRFTNLFPAIAAEDSGARATALDPELYEEFVEAGFKAAGPLAALMAAIVVSTEMLALLGDPPAELDTGEYGTLQPSEITIPERDGFDALSIARNTMILAAMGAELALDLGTELAYRRSADDPPGGGEDDPEPDDEIER